MIVHFLPPPVAVLKGFDCLAAMLTALFSGEDATRRLLFSQAFVSQRAAFV